MGGAMVECELARMIVDEHRDEQVIFLKDVAGGRMFPIVIGIFEATVIDRILKDRRAERPLTHDLLVDVIRGLGARLDAVRIEELKDDVYFASLVLSRDGSEVLVDARPSDAVAMALHERVPIFVAESVLTRAARSE